MPYEGWYNKKPNISHLHEFGAPVWILLPGQKIDWKMQPKSKRHIYVSFDDGTGAIKYYNTKMRNVLTSRNFKQMTPPQPDPITKDVDITPDSQHEGESDGDAPPTGITGSDDITLTLEPGSSRKHKRSLLEGDIDINDHGRLVKFVLIIKTFTVLIQKKKMRTTFLLWKKFIQ